MAEACLRANCRFTARLRRTRNAVLVAFTMLLAGRIAIAQGMTGKAFGSLLNPPAPAKSEAPAAPTANTSTQPSNPAAIPLPDVAARAEELKRVLRNATDQLPAADQLEAAKSTLDDRDQDLNARQKEVDSLLASTANPMELREQEKYWRTAQQETANTRSQLLNWANAAQSAFQKAMLQQPIWQATLEENQNTPGLGPILDVIQHSIHDLKDETSQAQDLLKIIVNLQVRAATQDQLALDTLERLVRAREYQDRRLFERDSRPLWQFRQRRALGEGPAFYALTSARLLSIRSFAAQSGRAIFFLLVMLLLSLIGANRLCRAMRQTEPATPSQVELDHITRHWVALGLLPVLVFGYLLAPFAPLPLISVALLVSFVPILILLPPLIPARFRLLLRFLAGVYGISACVAWSTLSPFHKRQAQFLIDLGVFLVFAYLLRPSRVSHSQDGKPHRLLILALRLTVGVLGAAMVANLFGFVKLSQFLGLLCAYSTFVAISMVTIVRVLTRIFLESIDRPGAQQLAIVRHHRAGLARWVPRALKWSGILVWLLVTINLLELATWLSREISQLIEFPIAGSASNVTLGGVLGFFLILLLGYAFSSSLRFLMREELLSRFHLARGLPELIASTLHYLVLLLVFFFAVSVGGVTLNRFTVLTGALGVGVGFGLQNIVNNFISGLILQFERPIHVGDVLDIDGTNGTVTRIGIRASTVRTFQGAEVIIPNANFISGKVINWTLSNPQRRLEVPVGVAYGSDLKLVTQLLERAANSHETVLTSPAPAAYFKEFGDSSLNFELQFWVMQESNTVKVKSEVALSAWDLLQQAAVEIPFPQRDLRLRSVDPEAAALLSAGAQTSESPEPALLFDKAKRQRAGE